MFGFPLVKQERNPHNYFKDHQAERIGLEHTETFCSWLREVELTGGTYLVCLEQLVAALQDRISRDGVNVELKSHVEGFLKSQTAWIKTMKRLNVK